MFIHQGRTRTARHNLQIASLLSFVAGIVNVAGFLAVSRLTTNVTGHFAFFVDEVFKLHWLQGFVYFLYIFFFFLGSFSSSFLAEVLTRRKAGFAYIVPTLIESFLLVLVGIAGPSRIVSHPDLIACSLLFAMGLQNSLVTRISKATVRTTHLTGLFTDLGIEVSQLFFYRDADSRKQLLASIRLRLTIIGSFFTGGVIGGIFYGTMGLRTLLLGAMALVAGMVYDRLKLKRLGVG